MFTNKTNQKKKRILMVCLGNICRSPLAEGVLKSKLDSDRFIVDSAGTSNWHAGEKPDPRSIEVAKNHQIDISKQRARHFTIHDFENFDIIYVMDQDNYKNVLALASNEVDKQKVKQISSFSAQSVTAIPDPYYGNISDFEYVFQLLDEICDKIASELDEKSNH